MSTQYHCQNPGRRQEVGKRKTLNGIDYLEVAAADQKSLKVCFVFNLPGKTGAVPPSPAPELTKENFVIDGGVRVKAIKVEGVDMVAEKNTLLLKLDGRGDFSTYKLRLVSAPDQSDPPDGFDPQLAEIDFSFKVECPSEFDCQPKAVCPPETLAEPQIDYLAKDYAGFRQLILDRLSTILPDWRERNPADLQVALIEWLAYIGDQLSYQQDAVATEAYLGTARKRVSLRRHARLLDYVMHEGGNARAWLCLTVSQNAERVIKTEPPPVSPDTKFLTDVGAPPVDLTPDSFWLRQAQPVFEPMQPVHGLYKAHNEIHFYTWSDSQCCLPKGSTKATLCDDLTKRLSLRVGDVLIFEEVLGAESGEPADLDPRHRHAVRLTSVDPEAFATVNDEVITRSPAAAKTDPLTGDPIVEIEWAAEDALPFPLCLSAVVKNDQGKDEPKEISLARGNVVLVDHGLTITDEPLDPATVPPLGKYRPQLSQAPLTFQGAPAVTKPATAAMQWDVHQARPDVWVAGEGRTWSPQLDLLASDKFRDEFVVEMESDGVAHLRFGDGVLGRKPQPGAQFTATYRVGNGPAGNVGAGVLTRVVFAHEAITGVRNPLPAMGGATTEAFEQVRQFAPQAFRRQERAVTAADYAAMAERHPGIQKAAARFRWTGSWFTAFVAIDRKGGLEVNDQFKQEMADFLERYRLAGYDVEIEGAVDVPLDVAMMVCVKPGYFRAKMKEALLDAFSNRDFPDGRRGFFHPDNFTFGQPVYLSALYERAMGVAGVASVEVKRFQRWGKLPNQELDNAVLTPGEFEIVRLDNDRNFPENGKLEFTMGGGM